MSAAAVIIIRQKRMIRSFIAAGATNAANARSFSELGLRESWITRRLIKAGVFVKVEAGRYYVSGPAWAAYCRRRRERAFIFLCFVVFIALVLFATGVFR